MILAAHDTAMLVISVLHISPTKDDTEPIADRASIAVQKHSILYIYTASAFRVYLGTVGCQYL